MNPLKLSLSTLALVSAFQLPNAFAANSCNIVPNGLVACYPFDGDAKDYSGNGNDGTQYNLAYKNGISGQSAEFNGISSYIEVPHKDNQNLKTMTFSAWVYDYEHILGNSSAIFTKGTYGSQTSVDLQKRQYGFLSSYGGTSIFDSSIFKAESLDWDHLPSISASPLKKFTHIVMSYDGKQHKMYINGQLNAIKDSIFTPFLPKSSDPIIIGGGILGNDVIAPPSLKIGQGAKGERLVGIKNGLIDDLRIYNRALTEDEIKQLYNAPNNIPTQTGECGNPAIYDAETGLVTLPAIDIPLLSPISGEPTGEIAVFSGKVKQLQGIDDFEIISNSLSFVNIISQYDQTHARYEYNDGIFANGGKLKACVSVPSIVVLPPNTRIVTGTKNYRVVLRHLAAYPNVLHLESAPLITP